jgi:ABC-2 type transport system permease protein
MNEVSTGDEALFKATYTDIVNAEKLLEDGKVSGIINVGDELSLSVTKKRGAATKGVAKGVALTIIRSFLEQYETQKTIITETAMKNPENLQNVIDALSTEIDCIETKPLTDSSMNTYTIL